MCCFILHSLQRSCEAANTVQGSLQLVNLALTFAEGGSGGLFLLSSLFLSIMMISPTSVLMSCVLASAISLTSLVKLLSSLFNVISPNACSSLFAFFSANKKDSISKDEWLRKLLLSALLLFCGESLSAYADGENRLGVNPEVSIFDICMELSLEDVLKTLLHDSSTLRLAARRMESNWSSPGDCICLKIRSSAKFDGCYT